MTQLRRTCLAILACAIATNHVSWGGDEPGRTWSERIGYGREYLSNRDYPRARKAFEAALSQARKSGPDHPSTAISQYWLGRVALAEHRHEDCLGHYEAACEILEKRLGQTHWMVLEYQGQLAAVYHISREYGNAKALYERLAKKMVQISGADSPLLPRLLVQLGDVHCDAGEYAEAERVYSRALAMMEKDFGGGLAATGAQNGLARVYVAQKKYDKAEPILQESLTALKVLGNAQENFLAIQPLIQMGVLRQGQGKVEEAERYYREAIQIGERTRKPSCEALMHLASLCASRGRLGEANTLLKKAEAASTEHVGLTHPQTVEVLELRAAVLRKAGKESEAVQLGARAKAIRVAITNSKRRRKTLATTYPSAEPTAGG